MYETINTQMHIACGTMENMCLHLHLQQYEGHIVFGCCLGVWASVPPWLIAKWLQSAPVHGQKVYCCSLLRTEFF